MAKPHKLQTEFKRLFTLVDVLRTYLDTCAENIIEAKGKNQENEEKYRMHLSISEAILETLIKKTSVRVLPIKATLSLEWYEANVLVKAILDYQNKQIGDDLQQVRADKLKNSIHQLIA